MVDAESSLMEMYYIYWLKRREVSYWFSFGILLSLQSFNVFFLLLLRVGWFGGSLPCASEEQIACRATNIGRLLIWQENEHFVFFLGHSPDDRDRSFYYVC